jgi:hypothetical protein
MVGWFMVFNTIFNNISIILWRSVLLLEETGVSGENHQPDAFHRQNKTHNVVSSTPCLSGVQPDRHNIIEILLKMVLNTINQPTM